MDRPGCLLPVISCVVALLNVTTSPLCSDTGPDGQFASLALSLSDLAVFFLPPWELSDSPSNLTKAHTFQYQAKMRCCLFAIKIKYIDLCLAGGRGDGLELECVCEVEGNVNCVWT